MQDRSEQQSLELAVGANGVHMVRAGETYAPTDRTLVAVVPNSACVFADILDPDGVSVLPIAFLNIEALSINPGTLLVPEYYTGTIQGKYWTSVEVTSGDALVYYFKERIS